MLVSIPRFYEIFIIIIYQKLYKSEAMETIEIIGFIYLFDNNSSKSDNPSITIA